LVLQTANAAFATFFGPGPHVVRAEYTQLYLSASTQEKMHQAPDALGPVLTALEQLPGVARALPSAGLERQRSSPDPIVRAAALSYVPGRSGQIVIVPKPYYIIGSADGTTHGTHQEYDQHVPLIFFGTGVRAGHFQTPTSPADLTPTLASRIGLPMPGVDGVALTDVFTAR
jgi:hypothetical protein